MYWRGPNTEKFVKIQQAMQVGGPQHREIGTPISTGNEVGDNEINFIKISFLSHLCMSLIMYSILST